MAGRHSLSATKKYRKWSKTEYGKCSDNHKCKRYTNRTAQMQVQRQELEITPKLFKTFAFKTHMPAYLDAGLTDLPVLDLLRVDGQPNLEEWFDG